MRRGSFEFGETFIRATGVLGLVRRKVVLHHKDVARVFPNLDDFRKFQLSPAFAVLPRRGQPAGARGRARARCSRALREYVRGDEYSRIDWKATARMRKPITREYEPERNQNVIIMMDTGRLMGATVDNITKLDYAIRTALALGIVCMAKGDNVGLVSFDREVRHFLGPHKGKEHFVKIMDSLYSLFPADVDPDYAYAFQYLLKKKTRRSLIVVFTDLVDADASQALLDWLCALHPRHARLCVLLEDSEVRDLAATSPGDEDGMFRKDIAMTLVEKRRYATARLKSKGRGSGRGAPRTTQPGSGQGVSGFKEFKEILSGSPAGSSSGSGFPSTTKNAMTNPNSTREKMTLTLSGIHMMGVKKGFEQPGQHEHGRHAHNQFNGFAPGQDHGLAEREFPGVEHAVAHAQARGRGKHDGRDLHHAVRHDERQVVEDLSVLREQGADAAHHEPVHGQDVQCAQAPRYAQGERREAYLDVVRDELRGKQAAVVE